jgi:hypothetical protein
MFDTDLTIPEYRVFGFPCHGFVRESVLTLPNGSTVEVNSPIDGDNWLLAVPGAPGVVRTPDEALADEARGWAWPVDIICWPNGYVHGVEWRTVSRAADKLEAAARFIYAEAPGKCWFVAARGVPGGPIGRRLEVSIIALNAPADAVPVTLYPDIPAGVTAAMLPDRLQVADVSKSGAAAILRTNAADYLLVRLSGTEGGFSAQVEYLSPPIAPSRTLYDVAWNEYRAAVGQSVQSVELQAGVWVETDNGPEFFAEYQGRAIITPRVTYSAAVATPQNAPDIVIWPISWRARDGVVNWDYGRTVVAAWFDDSGEVQLLESGGTNEVTAATSFSLSASGITEKSNTSAYFSDDGSPIPALGSPIPDTEYFSGSVSFSINRTTTETIKRNLRLNGVVVAEAELRRELIYRAGPTLFSSTNPDVQFELRGDTLNQVGSATFRTSVDVVLEAGGAVADQDGAQGIGANVPSTGWQSLDSVIQNLGFFPLVTGTLLESTQPPGASLELGGPRSSSAYASVHRYSNKLLALWTLSGPSSICSVQNAYSPTGFKAGTAQQFVGFPSTRLRGSYNSRTGEAITEFPSTATINWV